LLSSDRVNTNSKDLNTYSKRTEKQLILREHLGLTLVVDGVLLPYLSSFLCCVIALSSFPLDVTNRKVICIESHIRRVTKLVISFLVNSNIDDIMNVLIWDHGNRTK
jgi:hypothetical protein